MVRDVTPAVERRVGAQGQQGRQRRGLSPQKESGVLNTRDAGGSGEPQWGRVTLSPRMV